MKNPQHGNSRFFSDDVIQLKKQGRLLLLVRGLETLYCASVSRSWHEKKGMYYDAARWIARRGARRSAGGFLRPERLD